MVAGGVRSEGRWVGGVGGVGEWGWVVGDGRGGAKRRAYS